MTCRDGLGQWMAAEGYLYVLLAQFGNGVLHPVNLYLFMLHIVIY